ncbi:type II toxin-antitoxin system VapB family antitoxin [Mycobacterium sp.]|uniref:type II toxin-antitoxin system VapB family antitoxin n=1 Tax=Mycobacterium sp. TaxID=1785 RepID=UPI003D6A1529
MALNIKDPETQMLADQLAERLHTSKTGAVRHALRAQLAMLDTEEDHGRRNRVDDLLHMLRSEIWPVTRSGAAITKQEREEILGYSGNGV